MSAQLQPEIIWFTRDMTVMWPCRSGDVVLWMRYTDILSRSTSIQINDSWEMSDGCHIKITNRVEDFPSWFELHPTEVADTLVFKLMPKIQEGRYPAEPLDGPNLWRLKSGDRIAWVGTERPDRHCIDGVLAIMEFQECALAICEGNESLENLTGFGAHSAEVSEETFARCRVAINFVQQLGLPRTWGPKWHLR